MVDLYRFPNGMVRSEKQLRSYYERITSKLCELTFSGWLAQNGIVRCN